jgi:capsular polysaccharide biosynthesis protein
MTFSLILTVLRRRWKTIAAFALLSALGGIALWTAMPTKYSATTSLVVSAGVSNPFTGTKEEVNIRTEQEILGSRQVAERASEALGVDLVPGSFLLSQVDVAAPSGSQVLQVTVSASSPSEAAKAADALSEAYLEFRREGADTVVDGYLEKIDGQLAELQAGPRDDATNSLIATLQQQRLSLLLSSSEPGRIIGEAEVPSSPSTPGLIVSLAGGIVGGIVLGIGAALLRERTDPLVRSADRLEKIVGAVPLVSSSHHQHGFWASLADHVADATESEGVVQRVLLRGVGVSDAADWANHLENALADAESDAGVLKDGVDLWAVDVDVDEEEDGSKSSVLRSEDDEAHARIIDASGLGSARAVARLAVGADVVVLLVPSDARSADVESDFELLRSTERPLVVGFDPTREQEPADSPSA